MRIKKVVTALLTFALLTSVIITKTTKFESTNTIIGVPIPFKEKLDDALVLYVNSPKAILNDDEIMIDTTDGLATPIIKDGRTLVPLRFISEAFKADVSWDDKTKTAAVSDGSITVSFFDGNKTMTINETSAQNDKTEHILMDTVPIRINGKTYIPLSYLASALNKKSFYDRGLIIISDYDFDASADKEQIEALIGRANNLPVVGTEDKYAELLDEFFKSSAPRLELYDADMAIAVNEAVAEDAVASPQSASNTALKSTADTASARESTGASGASYSQTNVQVEGVDEADIIKTDGEYIYYSAREGVYIVRANPASAMELESTIKLDDFAVSEMYLHDNLLILLGYKYQPPMIEPYTDTEEKSVVDMAVSSNSVSLRYPHYGALKTTVLIYDISVKLEPKRVREVAIDGNYASSRKIEDSLYFVTNTYVHSLYRYDTKEYIVPAYYDSTVSAQDIALDYSKMYYFPNPTSANIMMIAGLQLDDMKKEASVTSFLGSGENMYVSHDNMYIAATEYKPYVYDSAADDLSSSGTNSTVYKFSLNKGAVTFLHKGTVPGTVLNQFSMDEDNNYFRIATTSDDFRSNGMSNNMYVLDEAMNITGRIENIAPTERIYSVRFMGNRAYMVTFRLTDPLYAIDLSDPHNPKIMGALKIPGYSDYLHPYDENHLIGFGKDTTEYKGSSYYLGMKISMFDITDINNPVEMFVETIGDRGTESELLHNHKALLFAKDFLAFPVKVHENADKSSRLDYGTFKYQGAYIYEVDMKEGFKLRGTITHLDDDDYKKSGEWDADYNKYVNRIIYINDNFFTLSNKMIKANSIKDLSEKGTVVLP